ncbi:hypothetical protein HK100_002199 [Physocladia obscura]|uniref:Uncharacterized protein n=1 Tax=Physocladia obscura TaxID=109957 RepID=A0AAD5XK23_9FUNG|nr:hypothetical protein HK100_002199 [Physocladia obscura]
MPSLDVYRRTESANSIGSTESSDTFDSASSPDSDDLLDSAWPGMDRRCSSDSTCLFYDPPVSPQQQRTSRTNSLLLAENNKLPYSPEQRHLHDPANTLFYDTVALNTPLVLPTTTAAAAISAAQKTIDSRDSNQHYYQQAYKQPLPLPSPLMRPYYPVNLNLDQHSNVNHNNHYQSSNLRISHSASPISSNIEIPSKPARLSVSTEELRVRNIGGGGGNGGVARKNSLKPHQQQQHHHQQAAFVFNASVYDASSVQRQYFPPKNNISNSIDSLMGKVKSIFRRNSSKPASTTTTNTTTNNGVAGFARRRGGANSRFYTDSGGSSGSGTSDGRKRDDWDIPAMYCDERCSEEIVLTLDFDAGRREFGALASPPPPPTQLKNLRVNRTQPFNVGATGDIAAATTTGSGLHGGIGGGVTKIGFKDILKSSETKSKVKRLPSSSTFNSRLWSSEYVSFPAQHGPVSAAPGTPTAVLAYDVPARTISSLDIGSRTTHLSSPPPPISARTRTEIRTEQRFKTKSMPSFGLGEGRRERRFSQQPLPKLILPLNSATKLGCDVMSPEPLSSLSSSSSQIDGFSRLDNQSFAMLSLSPLPPSPPVSTPRLPQIPSKEAKRSPSFLHYSRTKTVSAIKLPEFASLPALPLHNKMLFRHFSMRKTTPTVADSAIPRKV